MTKSIMIVGVGGQGTLLASRILGRLLMSKDYDVKMSEVHGMSVSVFAAHWEFAAAVRLW